MTGSGIVGRGMAVRTCRRAGGSWERLAATRGTGNGEVLRVVFSGMEDRFKASNKDSKVAARSCGPRMGGGIGFVPGWGSSGVSALSVSGWFCMDSIREDCGRDWVRLAGIVRTAKC